MKKSLGLFRVFPLFPKRFGADCILLLSAICFCFVVISTLRVRIAVMRPRFNMDESPKDGRRLISNGNMVTFDKNNVLLYQDGGIEKIDCKQRRSCNNLLLVSLKLV